MQPPTQPEPTKCPIVGTTDYDDRGQAGRFSKTFEVSCTFTFSTVEYCIVSTYLLVYWLVKPQLGYDTHYTTAIEQNRTCPRPTPVFKGYDDYE